MFGKAAMLQTVEAIINAQGHVQWLEEVPIAGPYRVLITILDTPTTDDAAVAAATTPEITSNNPLFGLWQDRRAMADVNAYLRQLRAPRF